MHDIHGFMRKALPNNVQAEMALLGAVLYNNKARERCMSLRSEMFYDADLGAVFARVTELIDQGQHVDAVRLKHEFSDELLTDLMVSVISVVGVSAYADQIRDMWVRRQAMLISLSLAGEAAESVADVPIETIMSAAAQEIMEVAYGRATGKTDNFASALKLVVEESGSAFRGETGAKPMFTGLPAVDELWQGMWPGRLYYLMARSRTGKTAALAQFCRHIAGDLKEGCVHIFSYEMSEKEFGLINLASETRWTADDIRAGRIGDAGDWIELERVSKQLGKLPIVVSDVRGDFAALAMHARVVKRLKGTRLIGVDFMDLVLRGERQRMMGLAEWVPFLGYQFKELAKELDVPILVLRQVNKARDRAESSRPTLTDLPYDGGQAADEVYALWRRELDMSEEAPGLAMLKDPDKRANAAAEWEQAKFDAVGKAEFIASKRRFGKTGSVHLRFDGPRMTFRGIGA